MKVKKACITNTHGETIQSLKRAKTKYKDVPKSEAKINVIMQCMDGHGVREIVNLLKLSDKAVSKYIHTFNEGGLEELLKYRTSSGRPCKLSKQEQALVAEVVLSTPKEHGCGENVNWTAPLVREFIYKEFGKKMSNVGIQILLHRMGFSFTRPTYVLAKADKKNR